MWKLVASSVVVIAAMISAGYGPAMAAPIGAIETPMDKSLASTLQPLVRDLSSDQFAVRNRAQRLLVSSLGEYVEWHDRGVGFGPQTISSIDTILLWLSKESRAAPGLEVVRRIEGIADTMKA